MDTKSQDMNWREAYAGIFTTTSEQELYYHFTSYIKKDLKVIILMPDSLQGDGYRKTTHPQPSTMLSYATLTVCAACIMQSHSKI